MRFRVSQHAAEEMVRRGISRLWLDLVLDTPEQRLTQPDDKEILQSRFADDNGRIYLVRAVVAVNRDPPVVVTVYRTSKIQKYWRPE
jgi:hypothetical protein